MTNLVEIRPLKPFVGSYRCSIGEADYVDDGLDEKDGIVVKTKVPRKRVIGLIPVTRGMTDEEQRAHEAGEPIDERLEVLERGVVIEHPRQRTHMVSAEFAHAAVGRGIAEIVQPKHKTKGAA